MEALDQLRQEVNAGAKITRLEFSKVQFTPLIAQKLAEILGIMDSSISELTFQKCQFMLSPLKDIIKALESNSSISRLSLFRCMIHEPEA